MFTCEKLNDKNLSLFIQFNKKRKGFNVLNKDFFDVYNKTSMIRKFFIRKNVNILKFDREYVGYTWLEKKNRDTVEIKSMYIEKKYGFKKDICRTLTKFFNTEYKFLYKCEKNEYNYFVMKNLGFNVVKGNMELERKLDKLDLVNKPEGITIEKFQKSRDENIRCYIQNKVFDAEGRIPLSIDDIYYDEAQEYYVDDGAFFISKDEIKIGYGQFIFEHNNITIVNFGIVEQYRGNGYGRYFLSYILNILKNRGCKVVYIKVDMNNVPAINLYTSMGFVKEIEYLRLEKDGNK
ncbi:GNAT family N-acetyltransferase [Clostridium acetobutylicum]|uniref:Predicted acetyltransferase domain containing protein n=1 Tax=Clostridium acetobutylicum (strain ATCC 824 / DSM 792 / JCM 1419 / IAM 19013 / LMG 5710 / NBRC 13948 / NRRL B-527 / VKM B-1787 / 2291 / W) TaxID=272562 RepID=Q97I16_CLOAB|nr:GNAT family N-acetyltransferase [Clostridium acetobutylicum]AAK79804.1 Predicted acetyltransferase domain containing protein [Clostridium acetobutylicum ATCC 824]